LQVHAEDGDKGIPREIRYGLVSEGNPFTSFFDINDTTGKSILIKFGLMVGINFEIEVWFSTSFIKFVY
jgi:hypothetical protein